MLERRRRVVCLLMVVSTAAGAQLPGAPILQNVWARPGLAAAVNLGGGSGGSVYAAAGAWAPVPYFQLTAGAGAQALSANNGDASSAAYGARVAVTLGGEYARFGFGAFAGVGGGGPRIVFLDVVTLDTVEVFDAPTRIPVGAALGWRHAMGDSQGVSVYATPSYVYLSGRGNDIGLFRIGIGADVGITPAVGVTGGVELGQTRSNVGGPSGTIYGLGVSYAFGRR